MEHPQLQAFLFCENIITDRAERVSLINTFDSLSVKETLSIFPFKIYISIRVSEGLHHISLVMIRPDDTKDTIFSQEVFSGLPEKNVFQFNLNLMVKSAGSYKFTILVDEAELASEELKVSLNNVNH